MYPAFHIACPGSRACLAWQNIFSDAGTVLLSKEILLTLAGIFAVYVALVVYSGVSEFTSVVVNFDPRYLPAILMMAPLNYALRFVKWTYYGTNP